MKRNKWILAGALLYGMAAFAGDFEKAEQAKDQTSPVQQLVRRCAKCDRELNDQAQDLLKLNIRQKNKKLVDVWDACNAWENSSLSDEDDDVIHDYDLRIKEFKSQIKDLICAGANPNTPIIDFDSKESLLQQYTDDEKMVSYLLKHGANPNTRRQGMPPLYQDVDESTIHLLLNYGADVNKPKNKKELDGWTFLHATAGTYYSPALMKRVLQLGAFVNAVSLDGTALNMLTTNAASQSESFTKLQLLLDAGIDLGAKGRFERDYVKAEDLSIDTLRYWRLQRQFNLKIANERSLRKYETFKQYQSAYLAERRLAHELREKEEIEPGNMRILAIHIY